MARKLTEQDRQRGERLVQIRDALGVTQEAVVAILNDAAQNLGLPARYKYYTVSRMESGSMSFEDAATWLAIAPPSMGCTWEWFALGRPREPAASNLGQVEAPAETPAKLVKPISVARGGQGR